MRRRQREKKRRTEGLGNATHAEVNTIDDREIHPLARRAGDDDARYPRFPFGEDETPRRDGRATTTPGRAARMRHVRYSRLYV